MAGNVFNEKDSMDINELASLNGDISPELIEQLQQKLSNDAKNFSSSGEDKPAFDASDDTTLFEEPSSTPPADAGSEDSAQTSAEEKPAETKPPEKKHIQLDKNFDDNFIKKYKAKLDKQRMGGGESNSEKENAASSINSSVFASQDTAPEKQDENIDKISNGKITEKALTREQKNYNDSLDYLDGNVKYSKYVIYIDPQNVDFIEGLTVKERKNLINKILREQDDIAITKQKFKIVQTVIKHAIVAILTIAISIPVIYITVNASLEATINNYRRSQNIFQTLYKENGKISNNR